METKVPLTVEQALTEEYVRLRRDDDPTADEMTAKGVTLRDLYARIHADAKAGKPRSALCLSGGGIRSATFGLGLMQGLAHLKLLPQFDFLSSVSGGGYIASWLSSWARRDPAGMAGVSEELDRKPVDPITPESVPVTHLRDYSNYLIPKLGIGSGDTWAFVSIYLRNVFLNSLILIPLLVAALLLPRLLVGGLNDVTPQTAWLCAYAAAALIFFSMIVLAALRPVRNRETRSAWSDNRGFLVLFATPLTVASALLVIAWGKLAPDPSLGQTLPPDITRNVIVLSAVASAIGSIVYSIRFALASAHERRSQVRPDSSVGAYIVKKAIHETAAALLSGAAAGGLLLYLARAVFATPVARFDLPTLANWQTLPATLPQLLTERYVCFAVPAVLVILFLQSALFIGLSTWWTEEYDREWWGRAAGWIVALALLWIGCTALTVYGPVLILFLPRIAALVGAGSGATALGLGRSPKSNPSQPGGESTAVKIALAVAVPLFVILLLSSLALATSYVLLKRDHTPALSETQLFNGATYRVTQQATTTAGGQPATRLLRSDEYPAFAMDRYRALRHLYIVDRSNAHQLGAIFLLLVAAAVLASVFIGVNQYSMHSLYRNRLVRAYLGASRRNRFPNPFSGFDPNDDLAIHRLRPELFWFYSFRDVPALAKALVAGADPLLAGIYERLSSNTQRVLRENEPATAADLLAEDLSALVTEYDLADGFRRPERYEPLLAVRNRALLDSRYPAFFQGMTPARPLHVVNMTLNLVAGDDLAWQQRMAESFTATALHCGSFRVGYRTSEQYGGPDGITLGTAMGISGAAANPNMGYNSSPPLAFLMTLFNVRLGWWLGNPGKAGNTTWTKSNPRFALRPLIDEALGRTNDRNPYVNLSDGGHFENLGVYEMVLRRCHQIIVSDASADFPFDFESLGNAIRKIRIDFGVPITIERMGIFPRAKEEPQQRGYYAVATVHYRAVDPDGVDGTLLYIKPTFYGSGEPYDVYNYAQSSRTFPHESTGDQFFTESQFESYRALGLYIFGTTYDEKTPPKTIAELLKPLTEKTQAQGAA